MKKRCEVEKTLKVAFEEISLVRVRCKGCGDAAIEMPLSAMVNGTLTCPGCGRDLRKSAANVEKALADVANGLVGLQKCPHVELQFVLSLGTEDA